MLELIFNPFFLVLFPEGLPPTGSWGRGLHILGPHGLTGAGAPRRFGGPGPGHPLHRPMLTACRKSVSSFLRFLHLAAASLFRSRLTRRRSSSSGLIWGVEGAMRWILGHWLSGTCLVR